MCPAFEVAYKAHLALRFDFFAAMRLPLLPAIRHRRFVPIGTVSASAQAVNCGTLRNVKLTAGQALYLRKPPCAVVSLRSLRVVFVWSEFLFNIKA
jgi:hypothetical protein